MYRIEELITIASEKGASDVHLIAGLPPKCRIDGLITNLTEETLTHEDCEEYGRQLAGEDVSEILHRGQLDLSAAIAGCRIRINLFRQQGSLSAALRLLNSSIPQLDDLLPQAAGGRRHLHGLVRHGSAAEWAKTIESFGVMKCIFSAKRNCCMAF